MDKKPARLKLIDSLAESHSPQIAICAASRNVVNAVIEVANETKQVIILSADRGQVECAELGGGRVESWTSADFVAHVRKRDAGQFVVLERSPVSLYPRNQAKPSSALEALAQAKTSLSADIEAGFDLFHIAAGLNFDGSRLELDAELAVQDELYRHAVEESRINNKQVSFDLGTPQVDHKGHQAGRFEDYLERSSYTCSQQGFPQPLFITADHGTFVSDFKNFSFLDRPISGAAQDPLASALSELADLCSFRGYYVRARHCDFLSKKALSLLYPLGIQAADFGLELALNETRTILKLCDMSGANNLRSGFLEEAYRSGAWQDQGQKGKSEFDKALSCAHLLFSTPFFDDLKAKLEERCGARGIHVDQILKESHKTRIMSLFRELGRRVETKALMSV